MNNTERERLLDWWKFESCHSPSWERFH